MRYGAETQQEPQYREMVNQMFSIDLRIKSTGNPRRSKIVREILIATALAAIMAGAALLAVHYLLGW
jgi:hypothetical protein